jgi:threonine efflux protein
MVSDFATGRCDSHFVKYQNGRCGNLIGFENITAIALAFFIVTDSPGPANIAVATVAKSAGRRNGMLFGLGLSFGLTFWGLIAATGMGAVLQGTTQVLMALKICGGLYLLWLAVQSGRSAHRQSDDPAQTIKQGKWFKRGLLLNLSNPKAVIAWMAALSMGLGTGDDAALVIVATIFCIILGFLNYAGYAFAFSMSGFMTGYKRLRRWIDGAVAGLFAIAGFGLIRSALAR